MERDVFNPKEYKEVNREERFYCFLLGHILLASESVRRNFMQLWRNRFAAGLQMDRPLEVYVEVAALRDYWDDLGDSAKYLADTHARRLATLSTALAELCVPQTILDEYEFVPVTLGCGTASTIRWREICDIAAGSSIDEFTKSCFRQLFKLC